LKIIAALRLSRLLGANAARFSMIVSDQCQGLGAGTAMMSQMIEIAKQEKYDRVECLMTPDNKVIQKMVVKYGFSVSENGDGLMRADLSLR
jgi:ribosomal protein S18 acetylase RimI-like enzyme